MIALNRIAMRRTVSSRTIANRHGISLLEILISIGVVGIGLIGVAALIPLAHHKAAEGVNTDRMAAVGRRAFREFKIREYDRPGTFGVNPLWTGANFGNPGGADFSQTYYSAPIIDPNYQFGKVIKQSYCFDPLGLADRQLVYQRFGGSIGRMPLGARFPAVASDTGPVPFPLTIPRTTVLSMRGSTFGIMPLAQARDIFSVRDDLEYTVSPDDKTRPRTQQMLRVDADGNGSKETSMKRLNKGDFSWMATLVPETKTVINPAGFPITNFPVDSDRYTLSVVVFNRRVLFNELVSAAPDVSAAANQFNQEIVGRVLAPGETGFTSSSVGSTKEIHVTPMFTYPQTADWVPGGPSAGLSWNNVKVGDWVCLYQFANGQPSPPPISNIILKWFKVVGTDVPGTSASSDVLLTLSGPDWVFYSAGNGQPIPAGGDPTSTYNTYAVFVGNVETVYEKTVRLHETGAFTN